jgi:hypothetical protein
MVVILTQERRWCCPNCDETAVTNELTAAPGAGAARFHNCRGLRGLTAPMLPEGMVAKVEVREREDYVGDERVQTDGEGRPVMSVVTIREDGQDCIVFAPTAQGNAKDLD